MSDDASSFGRLAPWRPRDSGAPSVREVATQAFYSWKLILGCVLVGLLAGVVVAAFNRTTFTAESLLLVRADAGESVRDGLATPVMAASPDAVQRLLQSDIQILKSEPVVRLAADTVAGGTAPDKVVEKFKKHLKVEAAATSNIIHVTYQSADRPQALRAVQALIDAYRQRRLTLYRSDSEDLQGGELDRARQDIAELDRRIQAVRDHYAVLDIGQDIQLASARLDMLNQRAGQVRERAAASGAELIATASGLSAQPARVLDSQDAANAPPNDDARNTLLRLRQEREHLAAQYAPDYPGLKEVERKIAVAADQVAANARDRYRSERTVRNPVHDQLEQRRAALLVEAQSLSRQNGALGQEIIAAAARVAALRQADEELRALGRSRDVAEQLYKQLSVARAGARLEAEAVDRRDGALRVVQPPAAPLKGRNLAPSLILAGLFGGLGAGIAAASVAGLVRQVFLTPGEAERGLRLSPLAEVEGADPALGAIRLAAMLCDVLIDGRPARVIQIAGPDRGAKSAVALALAQALAVRPGASPTAGRAPRILLADLDTERGFSRRVAGPGKTLRLRQGQLTVAEGAQHGVWVALDLAGTPLGDPGAETEGARDFLKQLRAGFDWIVIAAEVDFSTYEARRRFALVDVNLIVVEAEVTRAPAARALVETVLASGGDLLGFVFARRRFHIPGGLMKWL